MKIKYTNKRTLLTPKMLSGFFVDWPNHPDEKTHLKILRKSYMVWVALDGNKCVGFINALSDGVFYAYIPLLEVLPEYQGKGIGSKLLSNMLKSLNSMYAIDLVCDKSMASFYESKNFEKKVGMIKRNYKNQAGS
ncbi:GNAT family N-acetyltransferase [Patescibacteria group bacterium]|nr:GNAT family N-acetyltransferase [Patescibacteria group bacterium]